MKHLSLHVFLQILYKFLYSLILNSSCTIFTQSKFTTMQSNSQTRIRQSFLGPLKNGQHLYKMATSKIWLFLASFQFLLP